MSRLVARLCSKQHWWSVRHAQLLLIQCICCCRGGERADHGPWSLTVCSSARVHTVQWTNTRHLQCAWRWFAMHALTKSSATASKEGCFWHCFRPMLSFCYLYLGSACCCQTTHGCVECGRVGMDATCCVVFWAADVACAAFAAGMWCLQGWLAGGSALLAVIGQSFCSRVGLEQGFSSCSSHCIPLRGSFGKQVGGLQRIGLILVQLVAVVVFAAHSISVGDDVPCTQVEMPNVLTYSQIESAGSPLQLLLPDFGPR